MNKIKIAAKKSQAKSKKSKAKKAKADDNTAAPAKTETKKPEAEAKPEEKKPEAAPAAKKLLNTNNAKRTTTDPNILTPTDQTPNTKPDFSSARDIECSANNCHMPNFCLPDKKTCKCSPENAEFELNKTLQPGEKRAAETLYCTYVRKQQLVYFLLELLLNMGAGHFYAGNTGLGVAKLIVVLLPCLALCIGGCMGLVGGEKGMTGGMALGSCLAITSVCAISIWWLVDVIMIATGNYTDGNGVPLKAW